MKGEGEGGILKREKIVIRVETVGRKFRYQLTTARETFSGISISTRNGFDIHIYIMQKKKNGRRKVNLGDYRWRDQDDDARRHRFLFHRRCKYVDTEKERG
ncbi:hypothetical protein P5V15_011863 [Pogonomyrmex californicus]